MVRVTTVAKMKTTIKTIIPMINLIGLGEGNSEIKTYVKMRL